MTKPQGSRGKKLAVRVLKYVGLTVLIAAIVIVVSIASVLWLLTPERLTPLASRLASDYLDADVTVGHVELSFFKTFPRLQIDVEDLTVVSKSLDGLPTDVRASLPADADSLLSLRRFSGSINVAMLSKSEIALRNIVIERPKVNLLVVNDSVSNFNIIPESKDTVSEPTDMSFSVNHFRIVDALPFTYRSIPDSLDLDLRLQTLDLSEDGTPQYNLKLQTNIQSPLLKAYNVDDINVGFDAEVGWDKNHPTQVRLSDLRIATEGIDLIINTLVDFGKGIEVKELDFDVNNLNIEKLKKYAPEDLKPTVEPLETDIVVDLNARLDKPLVLSDTLPFPETTVNIAFHPGFVTYDKIHFKTVSGVFIVNTYGGGLNETRLKISQMCVASDAVDIDLDADISDMFSDPRIAGNLFGTIDFGRLHPKLKKMLKANIKGVFTSDANFNLRLSDLTPERFHYIRVNGEMNLKNFDFEANDSLISAYIRHARLEFGSDRSFEGANGIVDSLLVVKMQIDTARVMAEGAFVTMSTVTLGAGTQNNSTSADTALIRPFGGGLSIGRLHYRSLHDSLRFSLRDVSGGASLDRWRNRAKVPRLGLRFLAKRIRVADKTYMVSVGDASANIIAHIKPRRRRGEHLSYQDSIAYDSVGRPIRPHHGRKQALTIDQLDSLGAEIIELDVDNTIRNILVRWDVTGSVKAKRANFFYYKFPLRNRLRNVDCTFTTDSVSLLNTRYRVGHSDFTINGYIAGIRGALNTHRPRPLRISFDVASDSLNINELVQAIAIDEQDDDRDSKKEIIDWSMVETDNLNEDLGENAELTKPIIVPVNIDANFRIRAKTIIYADLVLSRFAGNVEMYGGAVKLNRLSASNELGNFNITALYNAPKVDDITFGMGLYLKNIHINRLKDFIPKVDSVMPMIRSLAGTVNANVALTSHITPQMDIDFNTLKAALRFEGDSLVVFDNQTFRTLSKWLMFKHKDKNMIDSISIEASFENNALNLYPFILNIDRYRLGVMGHSNLGENLDYHISVLKSPLPFKFGINIKGDFEHPKIRLGGAKFKENTVAERTVFADTTRINLIREIDRVFARGLRAARLGPLRINAPKHESYMNSLQEEPISHADSVLMINEGFIAAPDSLPFQSN